MTTLFTATEPDVVEIVLPWPPSANTYYRHVVLPLKSLIPMLWTIIKKRSVEGGARKIMGCVRSASLLSEDGRKYRERVIAIVGEVETKLRGPLRFEATYNPPDERKRDLDNLQKAIWDAMKHAGVYPDDSQFREMSVKFGPVVKDGRAVIKVSTLGV